MKKKEELNLEDFVPSAEKWYCTIVAIEASVHVSNDPAEKNTKEIENAMEIAEKEPKPHSRLISLVWGFLTVKW